jgi:hypothetical protein
MIQIWRSYSLRRGRMRGMAVFAAGFIGGGLVVLTVQSRPAPAVPSELAPPLGSARGASLVNPAATHPAEVLRVIDGARRRRGGRFRRYPRQIWRPRRGRCRHALDRQRVVGTAGERLRASLRRRAAPRLVRWRNGAVTGLAIRLARISGGIGDGRMRTDRGVIVHRPRAISPLKSTFCGFRLA